MSDPGTPPRVVHVELRATIELQASCSLSTNSGLGTLLSVPVADSNGGRDLRLLEILISVAASKDRADEFVGDLYEKLADFRRLVPEERTARRLTILWALGVVLRKLPSIATRIFLAWRLFHKG